MKKRRNKFRLLLRENFNECCVKCVKRSARTALYDLGYVNAGIVVDISRVIIPSGDGKAEPGGALWENKEKRQRGEGRTQNVAHLCHYCVYQTESTNLGQKKSDTQTCPSQRFREQKIDIQYGTRSRAVFFSLLLLHKIAPGRYKT